MCVLLAFLLFTALLFGLGFALHVLWWIAFIFLIFWLMVIFASFGLFVEPGRFVFAALLVFALSISGALFLVADLSRPFAGLLQLPREQLKHTLAPLN